MSSPPAAALTPVQTAILRTLAYSDVFDFALRGDEVHRYLDGEAASRDEVLRTLGAMPAGTVCTDGGLHAIAGREELLALRRQRDEAARALWPGALRWARALGRLPFVRMVAVTGATAVGNVEPGADVDCLVVAMPGRVWLARTLAVQVVRLARRDRLELCPNWVLAEDCLAIPNPSLFAARELTQAVPVCGLEVYRRLRELNPWADRRLPNAGGPPLTVEPSAPASRLACTAERLLGGRLGSALEGWERRRKTREIAARSPDASELILDEHQCKGHSSHHAEQTHRAYAERLRSLGLADARADAAR